MVTPEASDPEENARLRAYPLLQALLNRRSRRFGAGMIMPAGPLAYQSRFPPVPLTGNEESFLAFAAAGITGYAMADLCYAPGEGGNIMSGLVGRTIASGDGIQSVSIAVTNDQGTWLVRRPRELPSGEIPDLIAMAREGRWLDAYQRLRVELKSSRSAPPIDPLYNLNVNRWAAHAPGGTVFIPINDLTLLYLNGLLDVLNESTGAFLVDERAGFRPAGLARFARSRGGHLEDNPARGRIATIRHVEAMVAEFAAVEQGMMMQNLALACEALGLGGHPNFANHESAWFEALGFRMGTLPASRYLAMGRLVGTLVRWLGRDTPVSWPLGLDHLGQPLLQPFCPPSYPSMRQAVEAVVALKSGPGGSFDPHSPRNAWQNPAQVGRSIPPISEAAIEATVAYADYILQRYGRFPAFLAPYRTVTAFQAVHLDAEFYDCFYHPEALGETQRADFARWQAATPPLRPLTPAHPAAAPSDPRSK
ncbi:MAG: hypothetical protein KF833_14270 [Verrucomicrobiae bacterium]|nr:hypothetical protein [Verrucomicrobiae bacterium]